jgi:DNA repair ATPase RecN
MATDYEKQWPSLVPEWCQDEIAQIEREMSQKPSPGRMMQLEQRKSMLKRIKRDYEAKLSA